MPCRISTKHVIHELTRTATEPNERSSDAVGVHLQLTLVRHDVVDPFPQQDGSIQGEATQEPDLQVRLHRLPRAWRRLQGSQQIFPRQVPSTKQKPREGNLRPFHQRHWHKLAENHNGFRAGHDYSEKPQKVNTINTPVHHLCLIRFAPRWEPFANFFSGYLFEAAFDLLKYWFLLLSPTPLIYIFICLGVDLWFNNTYKLTPRFRLPKSTRAPFSCMITASYGFHLHYSSAVKLSAAFCVVLSQHIYISGTCHTLPYFYPILLLFIFLCRFYHYYSHGQIGDGKEIIAGWEEKQQDVCFELHVI